MSFAKGGLGIVVHPKTKIADYCTVGLIGLLKDLQKSEGELSGIGNKVRIGSGGYILGNVIIDRG